MAQVALANTFLESYSQLPKSIQKKTRHLTEKLRRDPGQRAVGLEKLDSAYDEKLYSARIDQTYRAILVHPSEGDLFLVVWVDHHDDAYRWAERRKCEVNPTTGSVQVYQLSEEQVEIAAEADEDGGEEKDEWDEPIPEGRLLEGVTDQELRRCGVPYQLLPSVRALKYEYDLDEVESYLPEEAADALYMLAAGSDVDEAIREARGEAAPKDDEEPVDTDDFVSALEHPDSQRRFALVEDDEDLAEMLNAPLELWRVFLHPTQREIVERNVDGPVRVLGGPGTGKTVVLMHRASWLAREQFDEDSDRLLVTTFTANLAADLEDQLRLLCGDEFERIEVTHLHKWAIDFMRKQDVYFDVASDAQRREFWEEAYDLHGGDHSLQ
ncbi:MAG: UvrD-helicase domain-containing protein, partial [Bradymonadaceae bacterium]